MTNRIKRRNSNLLFAAPVVLRNFLSVFSIFIFAGVFSVFGQAPTAAPTPSAQSSPANKFAHTSSLEKDFFKNILTDQGRIWTSPFRLKKNDLNWLIPLTAGAATLFVTDRRTASALNNNKTRINVSLDVSRFGSVYAAGGTALGFFTIGKITGNRRAEETGLLAAEALINSGIVVEALKIATQRPRPLKRNGSGTFFTGGDSFPSGHSATAWTLAAIIDDEYGKRHSLVRYGAYGLAAAVSLSRYSARRHFLSDVLIGSAIGYGIGHFTFARHHDPDLDSPTTKTTKLEKYFPSIAPEYDPQNKTYGARLGWSF